MPQNRTTLPGLLSLAGAEFVLLSGVNADAHSPPTRSVVIPPVPPGQARIWIYSGSQPTSPSNYPHMEAVTLNGVTVGDEQLGRGFFRHFAPEHYVIAAPNFFAPHPSPSATVHLPARQPASLQ